MLRKPLNQRQKDLLQRISEGTHPVTSRDPGLAATVYALRNRGLVTTPRKDGVWTAVITGAGQFFAEHSRFPDPSGNQLHPPMGSELIAELQDSHGTLRVADPDPNVRAAYRRAIHAVKQHGLVPKGFQLRHTGRNSGDLIIQLASDDNPDETEWNRIRLGVRDRVSKKADLVSLVQANPDVLAVTEGTRDRALKIVESLAEEAQRQGHRLAISKKRKNQGLFIQVDDRRYPLTIAEEYDEVARASDPAPGVVHRRYSWQRTPQVLESVPSGRLKLSLADTSGGTDSQWADKGVRRLESALRAVVAEVVRRAEAEEEEDQRRRREWEEYVAEQEREKAEKRRTWEAALEHAKAAAVEKHRRDVFSAALEAWETVAKIRSLCRMLEDAAASQPSEIAAKVQSWIEWALQAAESMDPARDLIQLVDANFDKEPTPEELRPYLGDWSPFRPEKEYRPRAEAGAEPVRYENYQSWHPGLRGRAQWWRR